VLRLLRNEILPQKVLLRTYTLDLYYGAILCLRGMRSLNAFAPIQMCRGCCRSLTGKSPSQPVDVLANFQYYAWNELPAEIRDVF
ncbi:hypothetical protein BKA82DRAFT_101157, partial [Pisolithus tinctorius]